MIWVFELIVLLIFSWIGGFTGFIVWATLTALIVFGRYAHISSIQKQTELELKLAELKQRDVNCEFPYGEEKEIYHESYLKPERPRHEEEEEEEESLFQLLARPENEDLDICEAGEDGKKSKCSGNLLVIIIFLARAITTLLLIASG